jgi:glycosyltransferase involved in cell wall biosynthesis
MGHQVEVVTGFPRYKLDKPLPEYEGKTYLEEEIEGIRTIRVDTAHASGSNPLARGFDWLKLAKPLIAGTEKAGDADVVYTVMPPVTLAKAARYAADKRGVPVVSMYGDIFPNNAIELGKLKNPLLVRYCRHLEQKAYRAADKIIVHSDCYKDYLCGKAGVPDSKVEVVFNWADTDAIQPRTRNNPFSAEHNLDNFFTVMYAGTMGLPQGLEVVFEAAEILKDRKDILFVLIGGGQGRANLEAEFERRQPQNVKMLPMQPPEKYAEVLCAADVSLVTLRPDVKAPTVPSKLWEIMASGRPVLTSVDMGGDVPKIVERAGAGICVPPGNASALADAVVRMADEKGLAEQFANSGRAFVEAHASLKPCAEKYLEVFNQAINLCR